MGNKTDSNESMRRHWDKESSKFIAGREWNAVDDKVLELMNPSEGGRLLEIGFGSGLMAERLRLKYPEIIYFGLDLSFAFIAGVKSKLAEWTILVQGDIAQPPFKAGAFDFILEMDAIHHFPKVEIGNVAAKIAALLKPGGIFLSAESWSAPPENEREQLATDIRLRKGIAGEGRECHPADEEWLEFFRNAGLTPEEIIHVDKPMSDKFFAETGDLKLDQDLQRLKSMYGSDEPESKASIFRCRKPVNDFRPGTCKITHRS